MPLRFQQRPLGLHAAGIFGVQLAVGLQGPPPGSGIVLPLVAVIVVSLVYAIFDLPQSAGNDWDNLSSVTVGIVLILASLIFRYGAELEGEKRDGQLEN